MSCSSPSACAAVGDAVNSGGEDRALAEIWNGAGWAVTPTLLPTGSVSGDLYKVSCSSATSCMAVGKYELANDVNEPLAESWNGETWTLALPVPASSGARVLNGISCDSTGVCMAVGMDSSSSAGQVQTERWNGSTWTVVAPAQPVGEFSSLSAVSCSSSTACIAVGQYGSTSGVELTLGEKWNGTHWTITHSYNHPGAEGDYLYGVDCTSTTTCTAVGNDDSSPGVARPLVETFDGKKWSNVRAPAPAKKTYSTLVGVACVATASCIAVGADASPTSNGRAFAETWNGVSWTNTKVTNPPGGTGSYLNGADCTSAGQCTFAGGYTARSSVDRTLVEIASAG